MSRFDKNRNDDDFKLKKKKLPSPMTFTLIAIISILAYGGYYIFNMTFDNNNKKGFSSSLKEASYLQDELDNISVKIDNVKKSLSNIDNLTIQEIQIILKDAGKSLEDLDNTILRQSKYIKNFKKSIDNETNDLITTQKELDEAREIADNLKTLKKQELHAIKFLIIEDAKTQANRSFWIGVIISFPMGIFTSMIAGIIIKSRQKSR
ncbi:MAG: hypothetical protein GY853_00875 [PVC group bacterium]|nr:hypothetical protein [PVC group bacterium]